MSVEKIFKLPPPDIDAGIKKSSILIFFKSYKSSLTGRMLCALPQGSQMISNGNLTKTDEIFY